MANLEQVLINMKKASCKLAAMNCNTKNDALKKIADNLDKLRDSIIKENLLDIEIAEKEKLALPLLKRLKLDNAKIDVLIKGINDLISFEDPVNKILGKTLLDDGLVLTKISVPIGVIGVIFESRPDALVQISTLCLKSGNCVILKGGKEALNTNKILTKIITDSIMSITEDFKDTIFLLETREDVNAILKYDRYINLIIPRGSNEFVQYIKKNSLIPVLGHADGICHVYIDQFADIETGIKVTVDAKTQYVAVCNACETLLVHKNIANTFLPKVREELNKKNVRLKGCSETKKILPDIEDATEEDWKTEYLDYILSIKIVNSIEEAIDHINFYGSSHTDAIVSNNAESINKFTSLVDSSSVMVNASTRFADGFVYGMGAEVGISTNKIHARGPVGLDGLVIYKFILQGEGHILDEYARGKKQFKHKKLI